MENDSILWFSKGGIDHKKLRAEFAGRAMQALLSRGDAGSNADVARASVAYADHLIDELAKGDSRGR